MIKFDITGLDEIIKQVEKIATPKELEEVDRKAVKECLELAKPVVQSNMRKSKDVSKSGRKGSRTFKHSKDALKIKITKKNGHIEGRLQVDNGKSNNPWFYSRFDEFEYGSTRYPPRKPWQKVFKKQRSKYDEIFKKYYEELAEKLND